ncbi:hypothetical protein E2C01_045378 [Portunus trituberculatus]|uniref:Uncharacterized protein n=1 Tax=Portunus trituberculatus TaxID=210409 RepID=A0A5B7G1W7_PORTR|nr:hypothetical protein [Portunus trituberculatus]
MNMVLTWRRPMILSQPSLVDPLCRKVQSDPRPPMTGRSDDGSHHSPVGRKAAVHRTSTSQLPVSSRRLIISSQGLKYVRWRAAGQGEILSLLVRWKRVSSCGLAALEKASSLNRCIPSLWSINRDRRCLCLFFLPWMST